MTESIAWGDESVRMSLRTPSYLLAASWPEPGCELDLTELASIKPKGAGKLHWRDMSIRLRRASLHALAGLNAHHAVVIACELNGRKQERARRKCLDQLLPYLESQGIRELVLEGRDSIANTRDMDALAALKRSGIASTMSLRHVQGSKDARLWIPDQLLGAYAELELEACRDHVQRDDWDTIRRTVQRIDVHL